MKKIKTMKTITICGSMKYEKEMQIIALELETKHGYNVLQCIYNLEKKELTSPEMDALREAHYKKIDISDAIYVVDIERYTGNSTREEIKNAKENGKEIIMHSGFDLQMDKKEAVEITDLSNNKYQNILDEIVNKSKGILGKKLTGIYLHGSMAMGCFNPDKSDIDLIVVIEDNITDTQKLMLMEHIVNLNRQAPPKGLELSLVKKEYCNPFIYPTPFELHFSPAHLQWFNDNPKDYIEKMKGEDIDLAAHFTIIRHCGITLCGEAIESIFAPVPKQNYIDSICSDIENATEDIAEQPVYIILNLCRVLAFLTEGLYLSKEEGGRWGIEHLPVEYHSIIAEAVECYTSDKEMVIDQNNASVFANKIMQMIKEKV